MEEDGDRRRPLPPALSRLFSFDRDVSGSVVVLSSDDEEPVEASTEGHLERALGLLPSASKAVRRVRVQRFPGLGHSDSSRWHWTQAILPPATVPGELISLPLVLSAADCSETPAGDLASLGLEKPERVKALIDACQLVVRSRKAPFDLAVLPVRPASALAAALTLPPILVHSVRYARSVAALHARASSGRAVAASQSGVSVAALSSPPDTLLYGSTSAAIAATGECIRLAVGDVASGARFAATVLGRPPGHHAGVRCRLGEGNNGFCFVNSGMLAVEALSLEHALSTVAGDRDLLIPDPRLQLLTLLELVVSRLSNELKRDFSPVYPGCMLDYQEVTGSPFISLDTLRASILAGAYAGSSDESAEAHLLRDLQRIPANLLQYHGSPHASDRLSAEQRPLWFRKAEQLAGQLRDFEATSVLPRLQPPLDARPADAPAALRVLFLDVDTHCGNGSLELIAQLAAQRGLEANSLAFMSPYLREVMHSSWCFVCGDGGDDLMLCESCSHVAHPTCVGLDAVPTGDWHCSVCEPSGGAAAGRPRAGDMPTEYDAVTLEHELQARYTETAESDFWKLPWTATTSENPNLLRSPRLYYHRGPARDVRDNYVRPRSWDAVGPAIAARLVQAQGTQWTPVVVEAECAGLHSHGRRETIRPDGPPVSARWGAPAASRLATDPPASSGVPFTVRDVLLEMQRRHQASAPPPAAASGSSASARVPPDAQVLFASLHQFVPGNAFGPGFGTHHLDDKGVYLGDAAACVNTAPGKGIQPTVGEGVAPAAESSAPPLRKSLFPVGLFEPPDRSTPFLATLTVPLPVTQPVVYDAKERLLPSCRIPADAFHRAFRQILLAAGEFRPDVIVLSLGLDALKSDRVGVMSLLPKDFGSMIEQLGTTLPAAGFVIILEGGYGSMSPEIAYKDMDSAVLKIQVRTREGVGDFCRCVPCVLCITSA